MEEATSRREARAPSMPGDEVPVGAFAPFLGEERFRSLVEHIPMVATYIDEVIEDDPGHSLPLYISPQIEELLGYPRSAWLSEGELWLHVLHPDDAEAMRVADENARRHLEPLSNEYRMIAKDGRIVWVSEKAAVARDHVTGTLYWQGVMVDITARKEAEQARLEAERSAVERLQALDEMKNGFLNAVSHELRTPLTTVLGSALTLERLGGDLGEEDRRNLLRAIATNARRIERLLADLLDVDRLSRGVAVLNRTRANLGDIVRTCVENLTTGDRTLVVDVHPMVVDVDAAKVERIVENFLTNAVRHTSSGTTIWVRIESTTDGVVMVVEDDGPGVPADVRTTIFEPFRQAGNPTSQSPGLGIGLSLVARFAELHGGRAWVQDREGGGASFRLFLPFTMPQEESPLPGSAQS